MTQPSRHERGKQARAFGDVLANYLLDAYTDRTNEKEHQDAPLLIRNWSLWLVEAKNLFVFIQYRPGQFVWPLPIMKSHLLDSPPTVQDISDPQAIADAIHMGTFEDGRCLPSVTLPIAMQAAYSNEVKEAMTRWGIELADRHIARTHPDFEQAKLRMVDAYGMLFELEQTLRLFVDQALRTKYPSDWWNKIHPDVRTPVERRETDPTARWFDDFNPSRLKFADFDGLRLSVLNNWQDFKGTLGDRDLFHSNMIYLSHARDRIAHVNTLSQDDYQEFLTMAHRVLDMVQPHVQL